MRILVYPHDLNIGGSQINAIDLAAIHAERGHDVTIYGIEGPLVDYIETKGLPFVPARELRYRPAPSRIAQLAAIARRQRIDVVHGYEWPPCLDAYYGAHLFAGTPLVCTVLSMTVSHLVPPSVALIMGTEQLGAEARRDRGNVLVLEPPIDIRTDHPGINGAPFRRRHSIPEHELLMVTVSRLAVELKLDALVDAIDAAGILADDHPVRLVVVGDGEARVSLEARAATINGRAGREVVSMIGALSDPRQAYAAADVVVGMGSSALRAMAIGKPVVVQGELGFCRTFSPETYPTFIWQGFWGVGDGTAGAGRLSAELEALVVAPEERSRLGSYSRRVVVERFSLDRAAGILEGLYTKLARASGRRRPPLREAAAVAAKAMRLEVEQHRPSKKRNRSSFEKTRLDAAAEPHPQQGSE